MLVLGAVIAVAGGTFASVATADKGGNSVNNGGGTPSCGNSCDSGNNPTDYTKPCTPVPGNGCHTLPDTPCERGHGNVEAKNKHCVGAAAAGAIWLGYADTYRPATTGVPSIWKGSPGVIFVGCGTPRTDACPQELNGPPGDSYDAGAIRIDNTSTTSSLVVAAPALTIYSPTAVGSCAAGSTITYNPWPGLSVTIPPGGKLILTQTGNGNDPCGQAIGLATTSTPRSRAATATAPIAGQPRWSH